MPLKLGSTSIGSLYLGSTKISEAYLGNVKVYGSAPVDPYNPLGLPPCTMRYEFTGVDSGFDPTEFVWFGGSWTHAGGSQWDWTCNDTSVWFKPVYKQTPEASAWSILVNYKHCKVLGANTTGITTMQGAFDGHRYLESVALFDTSSVTDFRSFMRSDSGYSPMLREIPLFDTSSATDMSEAFLYCFNVESGALALYTQASSQANPPASHSRAFENCGSNTVTGAVELAQIPTSWGGTGA